MLTPSPNKLNIDSGRHHCCPRSSYSKIEKETTNHHDYKTYKIEKNNSKKCTDHYK